MRLHGELSLVSFFIASAATYKSPCRSVGRSVRPSVRPSLGLSRFALLAFLGISRLGKIVLEHAPAQIMTAPAQIITAPAQLIIAPAKPPATGVVVYTAHKGSATFKYSMPLCK